MPANAFQSKFDRMRERSAHLQEARRAESDAVSDFAACAGGRNIARLPVVVQ